MSGMAEERRRLSWTMFGTKFSVKLPRLRLGPGKVGRGRSGEAEWAWQAGARRPDSHRLSQQSISRECAKQQKQHRFLDREQVATIQAWLQAVPETEEAELLLGECHTPSRPSNTHL